MIVTKTDKKNFASIVILDEIINKDRHFPISNLSTEDKLIEPFFVALLSKGYLQISNNRYLATKKGEESFEVFMKRYEEFLKMYDIYAFVDLDKGEFAFNSFFDFDTDEEWNRFKSQPRFEDIRIAIAQYKKINPVEIVFMSFINEGRIDTNSTGWQFDLVSNSLWNEIEKICSTAITPAELGEDAIKDILNQGTELLINILKKEKEKMQEQNTDPGNRRFDEDETYEETIVEETTYYESYYDPFYVSPFWLIPLFLW